jgi:hypothetical protein
MKRIQRRRSKGWRMPPNAIYVGRPSRWGNPFAWSTWAAVTIGYTGDACGRRAAAVAFYRAWMTDSPPLISRGIERVSSGDLEFTSGRVVSIADHVRAIAAVFAELSLPPVLPLPPDLAPLRGHDLACWCPLDQPCHADVLLELLA